ncbi:Oidioi.mRNA.OKI2018_I69.XSR.g14079.t1.cds [Oikopleura dioica]|uniref:Oidioi.mRNA.OKI2018_I69.XSR.g14079.t1.cds n=1 Tax=Oikopleura dioica TaxID=34765 RepID=A0ABN7SCL2_OIKDI|nr:Oidioi.mRNA.OKI2018_I69.XSR.g14079.t1.cds [Oikopleura dioica]
MVMIFVSSHAPGPNYQGCIVLSDEPEFDIQRELMSLRNCMDKIASASGSPKIPLVVFSQCCYGSDAIPNRLSNTITSFATVSGEVAVRNYGNMMVPYVEILNRALNKYGANCDLYEILLYVQRYIENEKIPIGPAGQYMKGSHQQTLTKKLYFFRENTGEPNQLQRVRSVYRNISVPGVYPGSY